MDACGGAAWVEVFPDKIVINGQSMFVEDYPLLAPVRCFVLAFDEAYACGCGVDAGCSNCRGGKRFVAPSQVQPFEFELEIPDGYLR